MCLFIARLTLLRKTFINVYITFTVNCSLQNNVIFPALRVCHIYLALLNFVGLEFCLLVWLPFFKRGGGQGFFKFRLFVLYLMFFYIMYVNNIALLISQKSHCGGAEKLNIVNYFHNNTLPLYMIYVCIRSKDRYLRDRGERERQSLSFKHTFLIFKHIFGTFVSFYIYIDRTTLSTVINRYIIDCKCKTLLKLFCILFCSSFYFMHDCREKVGVGERGQDNPK